MALFTNIQYTCLDIPANIAVLFIYTGRRIVYVSHASLYHERERERESASARGCKNVCFD